MFGVLLFFVLRPYFSSVGCLWELVMYERLDSSAVVAAVAIGIDFGQSKHRRIWMAEGVWAISLRLMYFDDDLGLIMEYPRILGQFKSEHSRAFKGHFPGWWSWRKRTRRPTTRPHGTSEVGPAPSDEPGFSSMAQYER